MGGGGGAWKDNANAFSNSALLDSSFSLNYVGGRAERGVILQYQATGEGAQQVSECHK